MKVGVGHINSEDIGMIRVKECRVYTLDLTAVSHLLGIIRRTMREDGDDIGALDIKVVSKDYIDGGSAPGYDWCTKYGELREQERINSQKES